MLKATGRTSVSVPQGLIMSPVLFNISLMNWMMVQVCRRYKLGGLADTPAGHAVIQRDLGRMEKQADRNFMKLNKGNCLWYMGYLLSAGG